MSSIHSSDLLVLGIVLAVVLGTAAPATAVSLSGDAPDATETGEEVTMEVTLTEPFDDSNQWVLKGETELENANWEVEVLDVAGDEITRQGATGQSFEQELNSEDGVAEVIITVEGEVPELDAFNYEDIEEEEYVAMELSRGVGDSETTLETYNAHRFTEDSNEARQALDEASEAVEASGSEEAQTQFDNAVEAYNAGEFELAMNLAEEAQNNANEAGQTRQFLLVGGAAVVVVLVLGGAVYLYRSRQDDTYKLQ